MTRKLKDLLKDKGKTVAPAPNYMQLKLNIGTFCALLWALFGNQCNYYKELVKIHHVLNREECFTIRDAYTKEICARITWAIINNGRSFFGRNPVSSDFTPGMAFQLLVSCLDSITDSVHNALPVQRATFPKQWTTPVAQELPPAGRQMQHGQHQVPMIPPPAGWSTSPKNQQGQQGSPKKAPLEDVRHPTIRLLMDPYLARYNNYINLSAILTAANKRMTDLLSLPNYCTPTGASCICWYTVLGQCFRGKRCKYYKGHVKKNDFTEEFANAVSNCISKGVLYYTELPQGAGSPDGKRKASEGPDDA